MTLPKAHRLKQRQDFSKVYRKGTRQNGRYFTLRAWQKPLLMKEFADPVTIPGNSQPPPPTQIGISISTKVSKLAVVRNRIRRQLWAAFRCLLPEIAPGWQLVVIVHPPATQCDYQKFLRELKKLLAEAEVLHGHSGRGLL